MRKSSAVEGEQRATILDPIEVVPKMILPFVGSDVLHSSKLQARGGSGSFSLLSLDLEIATLDPAVLLTSGCVGEKGMSTGDVRNPFHIGVAIVRVLPPSKLCFGKSPFAPEVGKKLTLSLPMFIGSEDHPYCVSECRHVNFTFVVADTTLFGIDGGATLNVRSSGAITVTVSAVSAAPVRISSYMRLKLEAPENVLMLPGSGFAVKSTGGPRAWILDHPKYFSKLKYGEPARLVSHRSEQSQHLILCDETNGNILVHFRVGKKSTASSPLIAASEAQLVVCCGVHLRRKLSIVRSKLDGIAVCPKSSIRTLSGMDLTTTKGKKLIVVDGYQYRFGYVVAGGSQRAYRCVVKKCKGRGRTDANDQNFVMQSAHCHDADYGALEVRRMRNEVYQGAMGGESSRTIIMRARQNL